MSQISDTEMHRRVDDLANNIVNTPERMLTTLHYRKTIQAIIDLLAAQRHYEEKPGFWRKTKFDWHVANVRPGLERLQVAYESSYGPLDEASGRQFWEVLKAQAKNVIFERVEKLG